MDIELPTLFILDDDKECLSLLKDYFDQFYHVEIFSDPQEFLHRFDDESGNCRLLLLDLNLKTNLMGTDVYKAILKKNRIPTIVISSLLDPIDKVVCLELGINDYVTKPLHLRELHARIKNLLSIYHQDSLSHVNATENKLKEQYSFSQFILDTQKRLLITKSGENIALTKSLYTLLVILLENAKFVISRESLLEKLGKEYDVYDRSIDVQVSNLRKILAKFSDEELIQTRHGMGYVFNANVVKE
ncbi:response regulator transcription factor [Facilibium subflavum]|uniref:response regulator transcription factor n=1 Tax=Facilibium subflavum TaxID=2219058 RepID=UPI000E657B57|nr:response regulator transcription factor [Facilibium subflavum]